MGKWDTYTFLASSDTNFTDRALYNAKCPTYHIKNMLTFSFKAQKLQTMSGVDIGRIGGDTFYKLLVIYRLFV